MGWNGSGDFQRTHNFSADASAGIKILASRQDAEWANFEAGLENCVTRDGQNSPTADLPMGGQKHTNVGAAASVTQYLRADQFIRQIPIYCSFGGTAEAMSASSQFAITSLTAGVQVLLSCPSVNTTTSVTLGLGGAGTATVLRADGKGPARGQVKGLHRYVHDGANWILTDPSPPLGKIFLIDGSASAALSDTNAGFSWTTQATADGFTVSVSVIQVPGGVRVCRIVAVAELLSTAASASGAYAFEIRGGATGGSLLTYAGANCPTFAQFNFNQPGTPVGGAVIAEYVAVTQGDKIRLVALHNGSPTVPTSASASYISVTAID